MGNKQQTKLKIKRMVSAETIPESELQAAERILARLVARAFAADHPELFGPKLEEVLKHRKGGGGI